MSRINQALAIQFPDICPTKYPPKGMMSMIAGNFLEIYKEPNHWDCVATCFFIDCVNNIVELIEVIYSILKPGGVWINLGPLLYHFSDILHETSIELPYEDVMSVIKDVGFKIVVSGYQINGIIDIISIF
jgi:carnosine N-methyltransferase